MSKSKIAWTDETWNPVTGCTKISVGCQNCYAERMAKRLKAMGQVKYDHADPFAVRMHPEVVGQPRRWRKPRRIFVCSMGDLFHRDVPTEFIIRCFSVMEEASQHTFQVLTKRPERAAAMAGTLPWPDNVWLGTSVENQAAADQRIPQLLQTPAAVRFLSCEPLLGPLRLELVPCPFCNHSGDVLEWPCPYCRNGFQWPDWVIVGGESGPEARPMDLDWARDIRDQCIEAKVPFFFKQWSSARPVPLLRDEPYQDMKNGMPVLDGRTWAELPTPQEQTP